MYGILPGQNMFTYRDLHARAKEMIDNGTTPTIFIGGPFDWWPDVEPFLWPKGTNVIDAIKAYTDGAERSDVALSGLQNGTFLAIRLALLPGLWSGAAAPRQVVKDHGVQQVIGQLSAGKATYFRREDEGPPGCGDICLECSSADADALCLSCVRNAEKVNGVCSCKSDFHERLFACVQDEATEQPTAAPPPPATGGPGIEDLDEDLVVDLEEPEVELEVEPVGLESGTTSLVRTLSWIDWRLGSAIVLVKSGAANAALELLDKADFL